MSKVGPANCNNDIESPFLSALQQFQQLEQVWLRLPDPVNHYYQIGPLTLCLSFVDPVLTKIILPAFAHIRIDTPIASPDLTIRLWDNAAHQIPLPTLDWHLINRNGYHGYREASTYLHYFDFIQALSMFNGEKNIAYYVVKNASHLPWWVAGSPLQFILHWWLREKNLQLTHTAAIAHGESGVLLTGKGGSGKSTTTLACLRHGFHSLGEDYCILAADPSPKVYSIYQSAKLALHTQKIFPEYQRFVTNPQQACEEKALLFYQDLFPTQIKASSNIHAIVSLTVGNKSKPVVTKCDKSSALKNLMLSTLLQLPVHHAHTIQILSRIVSHTDCFELTLGRDFQKNIDAIAAIINR